MDYEFLLRFYCHSFHFSFLSSQFCWRSPQMLIAKIIFSFFFLFSSSFCYDCITPLWSSDVAWFITIFLLSKKNHECSTCQRALLIFDLSLWDAKIRLAIITDVPKMNPFQFRIRPLNQELESMDISHNTSPRSRICRWILEYFVLFTSLLASPVVADTQPPSNVWHPDAI